MLSYPKTILLQIKILRNKIMHWQFYHKILNK